MAIRLTTKGRYGIRAICQVAQIQPEDGPLSIQKIAAEEDIPIRYLEQIMTRLRRRGILKSVRGPGGGYRLNRAPDKIKLSEVIEILEGDSPVVWCVDETTERECAKKKECLTRDLWCKMDDMIKHFFDYITLQMLLDKSIHELEVKEIFDN